MPVGLCGHVTEISLVTPGRTSSRDALDVELPRVFEREVDDVEIGADRTRRLQVGRVVGPNHHRVIARLEQRGGDGEQRGRRARHHQHVVGAQPGAAGRDRGSQLRITQVVAVRTTAARRASESSVRSSPRSARRRSETELSDRLLVIVSYPSCSGDSTSMGIRRYFTPAALQTYGPRPA